MLDALLVYGGVGKDKNSGKISLAEGSGQDDGVEYAYCHFLERKQASWVADDSLEIIDETNHLVVVLGYGGYVVVFSSDGILRSKLLSAVEGRSKLEKGASELSKLGKLSRRLLSESFMTDGPTRTLWLGGIHRRSQTKADSKILSGPSLASALDPLDDQTFHFTAARSIAKLSKSESRSVGLAPTKSNLWVGPSKSWADFCEIARLAVDRIKKVKAKGLTGDPVLPFLASPVSGNELAQATDAFDISVVAPEQVTTNSSGVDQQRILDLEEWAYHSRFENLTTARKGDELIVTADAFLRDEAYGTCQFVLKPGGKGAEVDYDFSLLKPAASLDDKAKGAICSICSKRRWIRIRFESAQTYSDGLLYVVRHRDIPFEGWSFHDMAQGNKVNIKKEKPTPKGNPQKFLPEKIGQQDSLFCWVKKNWFGLKVSHGFQLGVGFSLGSKKGWLACDDGAMEIADFIFLDTDPEDQGVPIVSLIHVKGSKSDAPNRLVSVSDYEIVCGQAVKNLRLLDSVDLAEQLKGGIGKKVEYATWHNGRRVGKRKDMISSLGKLGSNYRRRVVVLQPRVREKSCRDANQTIQSGTLNSEAKRMRQLNTLLFGVQADCRALGAEFLVLSATL
ncbi:MAG: hypothetical protein MI807_22260 [Verrucomicrobiales bacterium]|nr:hypothetical protein [Verrucomicrobiales bacterium]